MSSTLTTREAAVQWLNEQGLHAVSRDWSFGKTVIAFAGRIESTNQLKPPANPDGEEIIAYRYMLCLHPDNGQWSVSDLSHAFPVTKAYKNLEDATYAAAKDLFAKLAASEILNHLAAIPDVSSISIHYLNRTRGETEENYVILGDHAKFQSIASFAATALRALAEHMGCTENDLSGLEVESCEPESWMHHYNATLLPGAALCFPPISVLGFEPPAELQRRLYVVPHLSGTEESFVCQSPKHYVLLYWHTTG